MEQIESIAEDAEGIGKLYEVTKAAAIGEAYEAKHRRFKSVLCTETLFAYCSEKLKFGDAHNMYKIHTSPNMHCDFVVVLLLFLCHCSQC